MTEEVLILKRHPEYDDPEAYNVLFEGRHVGRIFKAICHMTRVRAALPAL